MKRKSVVLLIIAIIISCLATTVYAEQETKTERRSALEFCELNLKRLMEYNSKYGQNTDSLDTSILGIGAVDNGDTYFTSCTGATLIINKADLTIESLTTAIADFNVEEQEGSNVVLKALIIISALEMDDMEAEFLEMKHDIDPSQPENVYKKYLEEYNNIIYPALTSNADKLKAGEDVLVYQGNYDYYASYSDDNDTGKCIFLHAKEHK